MRRSWKRCRSAGREEVDERVDRAHRAFATWRRVAPGDRARLLRRFAEAVDADIETLAALEVRNAGHTIGNARWEAGNVRDVLNYYSAAPERLSGRQIPVAGGIDVTFHEPLGVVGVIVPWNFPMPIAVVGVRACPGRGQHGDRQAGPVHPADRAAARASSPWRPGSPKTSSRSSRAPGRRRASASSGTRSCARSSSPAPPRWASGSCGCAPTR